jgi:hypothetical protein
MTITYTSLLLQEGEDDQMGQGEEDDTGGSAAQTEVGKTAELESDDEEVTYALSPSFPAVYTYTYHSHWSQDSQKSPKSQQSQCIQ